jgi:hypothetical protein
MIRRSRLKRLTKNRNLKYNEDGSLTLYAGAKSPGKDKESNWLPAPAGTLSVHPVLLVGAGGPRWHLDAAAGREGEVNS